jgi:hypothetical protein
LLSELPSIIPHFATIGNVADLKCPEMGISTENDPSELAQPLRKYPGNLYAEDNKALAKYQRAIDKNPPLIYTITEQS